MVKVEVLQEKGKGRKHNMVMVLGARFFADLLMTKEQQKGVKVTIVIDPSKLPRNTLGVVYERDGTTKPYVVIIRSEMTFMQKLKVLAHEMVHVKQYATGQLRSYYVMDVKRVVWSCQELGAWAQIPYMKRPWEIEAFTMEKGLMDKWEKADL